MYLITKIFKFDSAHNLTDYKGLCENLHGHTYTLEVTLEGEKKSNGMAIDFNIIKKIVQTEIIEIIDHKYINNILPVSTAENIAEWIWNKLSSKFDEYGVRLFEIKIHEGINSKISYRGGNVF
ncbi:MAG TPA: 6-carboxytetrahydropterin synthase QueD [bacterium]|nr:6-carboxytetrahydropterin synthase QueD [bacterium]